MVPLPRWPLLALLLAAAPLGAQAPAPPPDSVWQEITAAGVFRASATVDSVYIDRHLRTARVEGGDLAAYLMARLGLRQFPDTFGFRVQVDTGQIRLAGQLGQLPPEARRALAQGLLLLPPETALEARVQLVPAGPIAVRFHLAEARINGIPIPETFLSPLLAGVGRQYPELTASGRDLFIQVPEGALMRLEPGGVRLTGP